MIVQNGSNVQGYRELSRYETLQRLLPTQKNIDTQVREALNWMHTVPAVAAGVCRQFVKEPVGSIFKVILVSGVGYISYMLLKGVAAGIEVDVDSNFFDLFSSNATTRLNTGLNLTNGEQAGQFLLDLAVTLYATYRFIIRKPYFTFVCDTLNTIYRPQLAALISKRNNASNPQECTQELDELLKVLQGKLMSYEGELTFRDSEV